MESYIMIDGIRYSSYKPRECRYCYFWEGRKKGCNQKECYYLIPEEPEVPEEEMVLGHCYGCPYGRASPCIGFCILKIMSENNRR